MSKRSRRGAAKAPAAPKAVREVAELPSGLRVFHGMFVKEGRFVELVVGDFGTAEREGADGEKPAWRLTEDDDLGGCLGAARARADALTDGEGYEMKTVEQEKGSDDDEDESCEEEPDSDEGEEEEEEDEEDDDEEEEEADEKDSKRARKE